MRGLSDMGSNIRTAALAGNTRVARRFPTPGLPGYPASTGRKEAGPHALRRRLRAARAQEEPEGLPQDGDAREQGLEATRRPRVPGVRRRGPLREDGGAVPEAAEAEARRDGRVRLGRVQVARAPRSGEREGDERPEV